MQEGHKSVLGLVPMVGMLMGFPLWSRAQPALPPPQELIPATPQSPSVPPTLTVKQFRVQGSTVFSAEELTAVTQPFTDRPLTFTELLQARSAVTELYVSRGFITSGAIIPPQELTGGVVIIQVLEGGVEAITVTGTQRLDPRYIHDRLALATQRPLNRDRLLQALQILQIDPLVQTINAELSASTRPGENLLDVTVKEAASFKIDFSADNRRSPGVGEFRRQLQVQERNLTGKGDFLSAGYTNTDGSNLYELSYGLPLNATNGTLTFSYRNSNSRIIEEPFTALDILAGSRTYEIAFRQPISQTANQELALGIALSRSESETAFRSSPGPLSPGADAAGGTRVSAIRFSQEYFNRSSQEVIALRSQLSVGIEPFALRTNDTPVDSFFLAWRAQGQYVRALGLDTLLISRADIQLSDRGLVAIEQFGLGGVESVRGYRQDFLLTDNAATSTVELRLPVLRIPEVNGLLQISPFIDAGIGWNNSGRANPTISTIVGTGFGLRWQQGERLTVRFDYGIPLIDPQVERRGAQQNGLYFSLNYALL